MLTEDDVHTLIGHAYGLHARGKEDMPRYFLGLAERMATTIGNASFAKTVADLRESVFGAAPALRAAATRGEIMDIHMLLNLAASRMPEGFQIDICVERGSAWVDLRDCRGIADGDPVAEFSCPDDSIAQQVMNAIRHAEVLAEDKANA